MAIIYHITTKNEWEAANKTGAYTAPSLKDEGFIHCSREEQVAGVLERYFAGKTNLLKLVIDTAKLQSRLVEEMAPSVGETFPHIYGPVNTTAVIAVEDI